METPRSLHLVTSVSCHRFFTNPDSETSYITDSKKIKDNNQESSRLRCKQRNVLTKVFLRFKERSA